MKVRKGLAVIAMGTILAAAGAAYSAPLQQSYYREQRSAVPYRGVSKRAGRAAHPTRQTTRKNGQLAAGTGAGAAGPAAGPGSSTPRTLWHIGRASRTVAKLHLCGLSPTEVAGVAKGRACDPGLPARRASADSRSEQYGLFAGLRGSVLGLGRLFFGSLRLVIRLVLSQSRLQCVNGLA